MVITSRAQAIESTAARRQVEIDLRSVDHDSVPAAAAGGEILDNPKPVAGASCCSPVEQASCCEPAAKASCCGATAAPAGGCGCR